MGERTMVIYHGGCVDGFTAAWAAWQLFGAHAEYRPASYGEAPPTLKEVEGKRVLVVDFSYSRGTLEALSVWCDSLRVLDHHKTAKEDLAGLDFALFDMERSGAGIAWDELVGGERHWLIDYVEDRDLWRWALPRSKEVSAYISTVPQTFADWQKLSEMDVGDVADRGHAVLAYIDRYVREMAQHTRYCELSGYVIPVVNAPYINTSELVGHLAEDALFAVGWFQRGDGQYQYSLRSRGDFDVSEVAKAHGGGGHRNAAGFVVPHIAHVDVNVER